MCDRFFGKAARLWAALATMAVLGGCSGRSGPAPDKLEAVESETPEQAPTRATDRAESPPIETSKNPGFEPRVPRPSVETSPGRKDSPADSKRDAPASKSAPAKVAAKDESATPQQRGEGRSAPAAPRRFASPAAAIEAANAELDAATQAENDGNLGTAFERAAAAWEAVREFPADADCKLVAESAEARMKKYGDRKGPRLADDKPLVIK